MRESVQALGPGTQPRDPLHPQTPLTDRPTVAPGRTAGFGWRGDMWIFPCALQRAPPKLRWWALRGGIPACVLDSAADDDDDAFFDSVRLRRHKSSFVELLHELSRTGLTRGGLQPKRSDSPDLHPCGLGHAQFPQITSFEPGDSSSRSSQSPVEDQCGAERSGSARRADAGPWRRETGRQQVSEQHPD
ncbi:unnamed protein product [Pleuronectes platessa]|uniref:Uncharacterized protein n=1 Tax=Pleuronectes platessa TaxID=8262 RepID=A0A9N7U7B2_PLEPL|nr:unnamed protein product [Pleuronectes platessa]